MNVFKQFGIGLFIVGVIFSAGYFTGRAHTDGPGVATDTELYQDTVGTIDDIEAISESIRDGVDQLTGELETVDTAVRESAEGVGKSIEISRDIEADSADIRDISGELRGNITEIEAASRGLAEIFGVGNEAGEPVDDSNNS